MNSDVIIEATDLCQQSGRKFLFQHINWQVKRGEHWLIFGMNGCGKTTLLSTIAGYRSPTSGQLKVFGQTYNNDNIFELRRRIGWVSSSFFEKCYSRESALHIVLSSITGTLGVDFSITDEHLQRAKTLLQTLGMGDKINNPFDFLSRGEQQNVLIARALLTDPDILVLDEPGTGLDVYARERMLKMIRSLVDERQVTVIYVTHYPEEILPFLQKTLLLRNGTIFAQGDTHELITSDTISALLNDQVRVTRSDEDRISMTLGTTPFTMKEEDRQ